MKYFLRILPVVLAAVLQLLPLLRNIVTSPAAGSTFALILRWGIGSAATIGAFDACSGASIPARFTSTNKFNLTVGNYFSNTVVAYLGDSGQASTSDYFFLQSGAVSSPVLANAQTTTNTMPPGISFRTFWTNSADTIYAAIYGTPTATGTFTNLTSVTSPGHGSIITNLSFTISNSPATIANHPASLTNLAGANASFSVTAGGTAPLKYQWFFNTNTAVLNATNTTLTLTNVQLTDAGFYRVIITNSAGAVTSSSALLTIWQPPVITNNLTAGVTNVAGSATSFSVVAGGFPALTYQWRIAAASLAGATNTSLSLTNIRASQAGNYTVVITNSAGALTSSIAVLAVTNPLPRQLTAPVPSGALFQFTFVPAVGLTNTVQASDDLSSGAWLTFTNVPPPLAASPLTVTDTLGRSNRFYRVLIQP